MSQKRPLEEAYEDLRKKLDNYAGAFRLSPEDAADALQDSYMRLHAEKGMSEYEAKSKLVIALRNNLIDRFRIRKRRRYEPLENLDKFYEVKDYPEENLISNDFLNEIKGVLTPLQFEIISLRVHEEYEYAELAEKLGMTEAAIRTNICRARKLIKEKLLK